MDLKEKTISSDIVFKGMVFDIAQEEVLLPNNETAKRQIIKTIWSLPEPQNRRVYMFIVEEFSLTEIAKIENRAIPVIKRSVDRGIKNLQEKLKKFLEQG